MDVVVIDSGMGGLDVAARLYERLRAREAAARIAFVNVRPCSGRRYEDALAAQEKLAMLEETLSGVASSLAMDLLAVACNSLSALSGATRFYARNEARVLLIDGTDALCRAGARGRVYVFGTKLTIDSGVHRRALVARGVSGDRIVTQACPGLANAIQDDHRSSATVALVTRYVREALARDRPGAPVDASAFLACSHFGYVQGLFRASFEDAGVPAVRLLNPNETMVRAIEERVVAGLRETSGEPSIRVYSRQKLAPREQESLLELINPVSAAASNALSQVELLAC